MGWTRFLSQLNPRGIMDYGLVDYVDFFLWLSISTIFSVICGYVTSPPPARGPQSRVCWAGLRRSLIFKMRNIWWGCHYWLLTLIIFRGLGVEGGVLYYNNRTVNLTLFCHLICKKRLQNGQHVRDLSKIWYFIRFTYVTLHAYRYVLRR
jgi:hypothetical protein